MTNLPRMIQIQAEFIPQIEDIQSLYRNVPPETLSIIQNMMLSPAYKVMTSLSARQIENDSEVTKFEKEATVLVNSFLSSFEKMKPEDQKSVINSASLIDIPKEFFAQAVDELPQQKKHLLYVDIPGSVHVLPKDVDSSWMQIRKAMYPLVHDRLGATITLCSLLINANISCAPMFKSFLIVLAVVSWVVDQAGDPNNPFDKD